MVEIAPFKAFRRSLEGKSGSISDFICPPYDVIAPAEREAFKSRSPENVVRLELPDGEGPFRYGDAAKLFHDWEANGILQLDRRPSFYLLETAFSVDDPFAPSRPVRRHGVLVALRIETPGKGAVRPHEKTLPKAREDRLNLLRAVRANVSPIFGLFFDEAVAWDSWLSRVTDRGAPLVIGEEKPGLAHRMWKVEDPSDQAAFQRLLSGKELFIADGHHRYEVAWAFKEECVKGGGADLEAGWNYVLAYICPMEEPGLVMLPTHRIVRSARSFEEWKKHLSSVFEVHGVNDLDALIQALTAEDRPPHTIGWLRQEGAFLLRLRADVGIDRCLTDRSPVLRDLDVVLLHDLVFGARDEAPFVGDGAWIYTKSVKEVRDAVASSGDQSAFLLAAPGVASLARVAAEGEVMPPKTTYFYPKVPTGFAIMPLDQRIGQNAGPGGGARGGAQACRSRS